MSRAGDVEGGVESLAHEAFHVRLAGGDPDLANDNVRQRDGIFTRNHEIGGRGVGGERGEVDAPFSGGIGGGRDFLAGDIARGAGAEGDGDFFAGVGRAPDRDWLVALQDGVVGEQRREHDIGVSGDGEA